MSDRSRRDGPRRDDGVAASRPGRDARDLPPAARRALAEAEQRRKAADDGPRPPREIGGRGGPDPVRYGDWEIKGRAIDF